jgi:hypothetical protein
MSALPGRLRAQHAKPRQKNDWYIEPPWTVHALFDSISFFGLIHDPACGRGTIPLVATKRGHYATGSDLVGRGYGMMGIDFLEDQTKRANIITNPPYKLAEQFAHHALAVTQYRVAFLVRLQFLAGQRREKMLFGKVRPEKIIVLSRRPSMPPGDIDILAGNGTEDFCWIVWIRGYRGPPTIEWTSGTTFQE